MRFGSFAGMAWVLALLAVVPAWGASGGIANLGNLGSGTDHSSSSMVCPTSIICIDNWCESFCSVV